MDEKNNVDLAGCKQVLGCLLRKLGKQTFSKEEQEAWNAIPGTFKIEMTWHADGSCTAEYVPGEAIPEDYETFIRRLTTRGAN